MKGYSSGIGPGEHAETNISQAHIGIAKSDRAPDLPVMDGPPQRQNAMSTSLHLPGTTRRTWPRPRSGFDTTVTDWCRRRKQGSRPRTGTAPPPSCGVQARAPRHVEMASSQLLPAMSASSFPFSFVGQVPRANAPRGLTNNLFRVPRSRKAARRSPPRSAGVTGVFRAHLTSQTRQMNEPAVG